MTMQDNDQGPRLFGVYDGTVADNRDPEKRGRVLVRVPSVTPNNAANNNGVHPNWALPIGAAYGATDRAGIGRLHHPEIGAPVFVMFRNGDPDLPVWMPGAFPRGKGPEAVQGERYLANMVHWSDRRGTEVIEGEGGEITLRLRNRKLFVNTQQGDCEIDTKPAGKIVLNRGADTKKAARKGDPVRIRVLPGQIQVSGPGGVSTNTTTIDLDGEILDGSASVFIGD